MLIPAGAAAVKGAALLKSSAFMLSPTATAIPAVSAVPAAFMTTTATTVTACGGVGGGVGGGLALLKTAASFAGGFGFGWILSNNLKDTPQSQAPAPANNQTKKIKVIAARIQRKRSLSASVPGKHAHFDQQIPTPPWEERTKHKQIGLPSAAQSPSSAQPVLDKLLNPHPEQSELPPTPKTKPVEQAPEKFPAPRDNTYAVAFASDNSDSDKGKKPVPSLINIPDKKDDTPIRGGIRQHRPGQARPKRSPHKELDEMPIEELFKQEDIEGLKEIKKELEREYSKKKASRDVSKRAEQMIKDINEKIKYLEKKERERQQERNQLIDKLPQGQPRPVPPTPVNPKVKSSSEKNSVAVQPQPTAPGSTPPPSDDPPQEEVIISDVDDNDSNPIILGGAAYLYLSNAQGSDNDTNYDETEARRERLAPQVPPAVPPTTTVQLITGRQHPHMTTSVNNTNTASTSSTSTGIHIDAPIVVDLDQHAMLNEMVTDMVMTLPTQYSIDPQVQALMDRRLAELTDKYPSQGLPLYIDALKNTLVHILEAKHYLSPEQLQILQTKGPVGLRDYIKILPIDVQCALHFAHGIVEQITDIKGLIQANKKVLRTLFEGLACSGLDPYPMERNYDKILGSDSELLKIAKAGQALTTKNVGLLLQHIALMSPQEQSKVLGNIIGGYLQGKIIAGAIPTALKTVENITQLVAENRVSQSLNRIATNVKNMTVPAEEAVATTADGLSLRVTTAAEETVSLQNAAEKVKVVSNITTSEIIYKSIASNISKNAINRLHKNQNMIEELNKRVIELSKSINSKKVGKLDGPLISLSKFNELETAAQKFYETMRTINHDINAITSNTGISQEIIKKIKDHLFLENHILNTGIKKFAPEPNIAAAWQRLIENKFVRSDLLLLQHEYVEALIMHGTEVRWREAHDLVNSVYDWYNSL